MFHPRNIEGQSTQADNRPGGCQNGSYSYLPRAYHAKCVVVIGVVITVCAIGSNSIDLKNFRVQHLQRPTSLLSQNLTVFANQPQQPIYSKFPGHVRVLINARFRSGSSLTGELFIRHSAFGYFFEPLLPVINLEQGYTGSTTMASQILNKLLNCSLTSKDFNFSKEKEYWKRIILCGFNNDKHCNNGYNASNATVPWDQRFQPICHSRPNLATKVIRISNISTLMPLLHRGVKVIQLIRDPRGMYLSRKKLSGSRIEMTETDCNITINDLNYIRHVFKDNQDLIRNNIYYLRYEDLAAHPLSTMFDVYRFLNIAPDENIKMWAEEMEKKNIIAKMMHANDETMSADEYYSSRMGTDRKNPQFTAHAWRLGMNIATVNRVQDICKAVLNEFGYAIFDTSEQMTDLSIPSLKSWKDPVLDN